MRVFVHPHVFSGTFRIPASKSHTIRRLLIAALAGGSSEIAYPLDSLDTRSCVSVCRGLGVRIEERASERASEAPGNAPGGGMRLTGWIVHGRGGPGILRRGRSAKVPLRIVPDAPVPVTCDVGNSGTTLFLALAAASLGSSPARFTGDGQIRRRSAAPLLAALAGLGVTVQSEGGCAPVTVRGPWRGGRVSLPCPTSQYLSALLIAAPLAPAGTVTEIDVPLLNERPYVEMTLAYLDAQGAACERGADYAFFRIPGGASYRPVNGPVPGDFSSAAFPAAAAAISGGTVTLLGLDPADTQGDKAFFGILSRMGCEVRWAEGEDGAPRVTVSRRGSLRGGEFDLNATPDLLPAAAVTAAFASGDTALVNVGHARIKETDRVAVMAEELGKLGVSCAERPDGLIIRGRPSVPGGVIDSRGDHRIAMAFAALGLGASGPVGIEGAECAAVTYPGFLELLGAEPGKTGPHGVQ